MRYVLIAAMALNIVLLLLPTVVYLRGPREIGGRFRLFLPIPLCFAAAGILAFEVFRRNDSGPLAVLLLLWLIYCGGITALTVHRLKRAQTAFREQRMVERHFSEREQYYDELVEKQEQTKALWHDMAKYLKAAETESGGSPAVEQAQRVLTEATDLVDVGNRVLNVILNEYRVRAKANHVRLELHVQVPETLFVSVADLYILLGNTMDNAIDACAAVPVEDRLIRLSMQQKHSVLFYRISNPYEKGTAGKRQGIHGYGLKNVRACAKRYGGAIEISDENGWFCVSAHLNAPDLHE